MKTTEQLSSRNLETAIAALMKAKRRSQFTGFLIPHPQWVRTSRYRGKGRPRNSDYEWVDIGSLLKDGLP